MFFATTSLTEFWDRQDELLFAGPWCLPAGGNGQVGATRGQILDNPWDDFARFKRAVSYCDELTERLLPPLGRALNRGLGASFSGRYWRVLVSRWLSYHVQLMYDHHVHVDDAFKSFPGLRSMRLDAASYETPSDILEFMSATHTPRFHLQVYSDLLGLHGDFPARVLPLAAETGSRRPAGLKARMKLGLSRVLSAFPAEVVACELGLTASENRTLLLSSGLRIRPFMAELPAGTRFTAVFDDRRRRLATMADGQDEFERALISTLPHYLPAVYLEGHDAVRRFALSRLGRLPKILFSATGWHLNEPFKFAAAECAEQGVALWGLQHGGVYGFWEHADGEHFERSVVDRFYSWGWASAANDPKVRNLPHPQLTRAAPLAPGRDILFVPAAIFLHNVRLSHFGGERLSHDYFERQSRFMQALPGQLHERLTARFFYLDYGWRQKERLQEAFPRIRFDDPSRPFAESLRHARISVHDCPMTTFLEALAADAPTVLTWDPAVWPMREEARPWFERLRTAGILYPSPEDAARHVARIYEDPAAWWNLPAVREAREAFCNRYGLARKDWRRLWLSEIESSL